MRQCLLFLACLALPLPARADLCSDKYREVPVAQGRSRDAEWLVRTLPDSDPAYPAVFAAALTRDLALARKLFHTGQAYGSAAARAAADWPALSLAAAEKIRARIAAPGVTAKERFDWLQILTYLSQNEADGIPRATGKALLTGLPPEVFESIRHAAAAQPGRFEGLEGFSKELSEASGREIGLADELIAVRLRQIDRSQSMKEKLAGIELLSFDTDLTFHPAAHPEVIEMFQKIIPHLGGEEIFQPGGKIILNALAMGTEIPVTPEVKLLLVRALRAAEKVAPGAEALARNRDVKTVLNDVIQVAVFKPNELSPQLIAELKTAESLYHFETIWPGTWAKLKHALNL